MKEKKYDKKRMISILSNITFVIGIAIGVFVIIDIYLLTNRAPAGTCPIIYNRPLLYIALGSCLVSLVLSFFVPKKKEQKGKKTSS